VSEIRMTVAGMGTQNRVVAGVLLGLPALYLVAFYAYPIAQLAYLSFRDVEPAYGTNEFVGLANFRAIFAMSDGWGHVARSFLYTGICVSASFALGLAFALLTVAVEEAFSPQVSTLLRQIVVTPMIFIPAAASVMWSFAYTEHYGWVNHLLAAFGLPTYPWLVSSGAFYLVMLTDIWGWTPFMYLILLAGLQSLPREPLEAARVDGAGTWQSFWRVVLPMLRPVILIALTIKTLDTYRAFDYLWIMTQGGPGTSSTTLTIATYKTAFMELRLGQASAYGLVTMIFPLAVVNLFLLFQQRRGA
jgi:multiple sugar transport system permease protein